MEEKQPLLRFFDKQLELMQDQQTSVGLAVQAAYQNDTRPGQSPLGEIPMVRHCGIDVAGLGFSP